MCVGRARAAHHTTLLSRLQASEDAAARVGPGTPTLRATRVMIKYGEPWAQLSHLESSDLVTGNGVQVGLSSYKEARV